MIDSHCHLDHELINKDIKNILKNAKESGIEKLLTICTTNIGFNKILKIIELDEIIYGTYGIHPHESEKDIIDLDTITNNLKKNKKLIGIGETGLDFFYNYSNKERQIESFYMHIEAAINLNVPLIIHSRNAEKEIFKILNEYRNKNGKFLMHCFTGSYEFAKKLLELNTYFSASGIITFKNSLDLQETFKKLPLDKLLIETDSPYLAPTPMRGKNNQPSFIKYTASKLGELKNINFDKIKNITSNNFNSLFF
jgi:TatD DNase family protein